jgi:hypothetical protein
MNALHSAALAVLMAGCASGAPRALAAGAPEPRVLSETQGLLAAREALLGAGALAQPASTLALDGLPLQADVRFGDPPFGIEWVSADDRAHRAPLAEATPDSPLQIVSAKAGDVVVQVLVLDERAYGYEGNSLLVQRGATGIEDAERRVRRDVNDFLDYVRDQGGRL